ncbi:MAG: chromosome segregation protein SMC [Lachnospiraceae bacterium]|nr:chromosome segregation protein SMC [Lachnospiraceae bacterium]
MYLKSIEVQGFKSFANRILFEFKNGITGIVGPNGSGKSNVADAVRWVLGEQSAKQLRGNSMQDVIFSGTELRRPQGFAYVAITFDNADHKLPVEFDEVTVARRVYRSGESEYLLNGTGCRLRDMQELFLDTGIGKEGYSIIGQGQIDRIVSGKPEERRELLDEAAGIVKFKKRKALTEKNLAEEQKNLERVQDIIAELEKQLGPLEKQSGVAREYLRLKEELKRTEINQFLLEQGLFGAQEEELAEKQSIVSGELAQARQAYDDTKSEYERAEQELEQYAAAIDAAKEEKARCEVEFEKTEGDIRLLQGQMESIRQNSLHFSDTLSQVEASLEAKQEELSGYLAKKQETDGALDVLDDEQTETACRIQEIRSRIAELNREIEKSNNDIFRLLNENTNNKANLQRYETMREQNAIKKAELNKRVLEHKSLEAQARDAILECEERLKQASDTVQKQAQTIQSLEGKAAEAGQEIERLNRELEEKQKGFLADSSRLDSLKNITERYEGYGNSVRRIMEQKEHFPGIEGVVADLIKVDKSYETAIETALGGSIQNIVTDSEQTAKELIEFLKKTKAGRATFLPLTSITPARNNNESALREPGVIGLASSLVRAEKQYGALVQFLLGRIFVVDTIDHALALARKYGYTLRIVTVEGEQLNPGGSLSGGAYKNSGSLLSRRREMEELAQRIDAAKVEIDRLSADREEKRAHRNELRAKAELAKEELRELSVLQNTAKINLDQAGARSEALAEEFSSFAKELRAMEGQTAALLESIGKLNDEYKKNTELHAQKEKRIDECSALLKEKQREEQEKAEALSDLKSRFSALEQNSGNLLENIRRVRAELTHFEEEKAKLNESARNFESTLKEKEEELENRLQSRAENETKTGEIAARIAELSAEREEKNRLHKGFFAKREELSGRIALLDKEAFRLAGQREKL